MVTDILQFSNSPTQQRDHTPKFKSFETIIQDENDNEFPITINIDYHDQYGWDKWEIIVTGYDFQTEAKFENKKILNEIVQDLIRENETDSVNFNI